MSCLTLEEPLLAVNSLMFNSSQKKIQVRAEVQFGKPSSKNCPGHGICRVEVTNKSIPLQNIDNCASSFAFIQQDNDKQIAFYFLNSSLCKKARLKYFRKEMFKVQEPIMLPYGISQSFGVEQNFIIESGLYPIIKTDKHSIVVFSNR